VKNLRKNQPFFMLFLGVILVVTIIPTLSSWLGASFSSPIQGGPGTHFMGLTMGDNMVRFDLMTLGFVLLTGLLTVLYHRATNNRFTLLLGTTLALAGLVSSISFINGFTLPDGSITFFDELLGADIISRAAAGLIMVLGIAVIRWGNTRRDGIALVQLGVPVAIVSAFVWAKMPHYAHPGNLVLLDANLVTIGLYSLAYAGLRKELRHHRLRFFGQGIVGSFIPLAVSQLLVTFAVKTVVEDPYHVATFLRWIAWLIPTAGLGIDYVNSFYAKGVNKEMRYLRKVIDAIPHYIYARDTAGRYVLVNQAVADFFNQQVHEIEGRHLMDVHDEVEMCQLWLAEDKETLRTGQKSFLPENLALNSHGKEIWINTIKTPLQSTYGITDQVLGVSIDVSEQRRTEQELAHALQAAKGSSIAKSEFLANMSHEIRTPMNCVIGLSDMLKEMNPTAQQQQYLEMISVSGATLLTLISDILDFSKIEAGQLELDLIDTDLQVLVEETVAQIAFTAQTKGLEMACRFAPGMPTRLMIDPCRLRQVLTNLLNNSAKFTETGHIYLNIEPVGEADGKLDICFSVADTGIGIEEENLAHIFDKFTQAEAGTTRRFGGTGLGLTISQHLVELMHGEITASSVVGEGTAVSFTIPLQPTLESLAAEPTTPTTVSNVLILTEHKLSGEVISEQLHSLGHTCHIAVGQKESRVHLNSDDFGHTFNLVIVERQMIEQKQLHLKDRIAKLPEQIRPQVVMLNDISASYDEDQLIKFGVNRTLEKPVRLSQLSQLVAGQSTALPTAASVSPPTDVPPVNPATITLDLDQDPEDGPRILLAEDNPFNQKVAVAMLRLLGCRADVADNGVQAVDKARRNTYDLVFMDCQMPVMDGYEATRRIRQLPAPANEVCIVAMTANALSGDRDACFKTGMDDFMSKPITKDVLAAMLDEWGILEVEAKPEKVST
jgi:two-component system sensor histidine kinase/response regulator